jgi:hypothetical protein
MAVEERSGEIRKMGGPALNSWTGLERPYRPWTIVSASALPRWTPRSRNASGCPPSRINRWERVTSLIFHMEQLDRASSAPWTETAVRKARPQRDRRPAATAIDGTQSDPPEPIRNPAKPSGATTCPCGSGKVQELLYEVRRRRKQRRGLQIGHYRYSFGSAGTWQAA